MSYILTKTNGTTLTTVKDGSIDRTTALTFVGKNYAGYGEIINENLVGLLENFADATEPAGTKLTGQLWYNTATKKLGVWDGAGHWKTSPIIEVSQSKPTYFNKGDLWFNDSEGTLWVKSVTDFIKIGPMQETASTVVPIRVVDNLGSNHDILEIKVGSSNICIGVVSPDNFVINAADTISVDQTPYFTSIKRGITLAGADLHSGKSATTSTNVNTAILWGTASHSLDTDSLGGLPAKSYLTSGSGKTFINSDEGLLIGLNADVGAGMFRFHANTSATEGKLSVYGQKMSFNFLPLLGTDSNSSPSNVLNIVTTAYSSAQILPSATVSIDVGSPSDRFNSLSVRTIDSSVSVSTVLTTTTNLTVTGDARSTVALATSSNTNTVATTKFVHDVLPDGVIVMWSGTLLPAGWVLCNGANGTPNLQDRFIIGGSAAGGTGGGAVTPRTTVQGYATISGGSKDAVTVYHTHGVSDPGHTHTTRFNRTSKSDNSTPWMITDPNVGENLNGTVYLPTNSVGTGVSINASGYDGTNMNLVPYYALAFIMKKQLA